MSARDHLDRALTVVRRDPSSAMALNSAALEHALLMGLYTAHRDLGALDEARSCLQQAYQVNPENAFTLTEMAIDAHVRGEARGPLYAGWAVLRAVRDANGNLALDRLRENGLLPEKRYRLALSDWERTRT